MIREIKRIIIGNKLRKFLNTCLVINYNDGDTNEPSVIISNNHQIISFFRSTKNANVHREDLLKYIGLEISDDIILEVVENLYKHYIFIIR